MAYQEGDFIGGSDFLIEVVDCIQTLGIEETLRNGIHYIPSVGSWGKTNKKYEQTGTKGFMHAKLY